ncbi:MAG TPA: AMP-binding protein, partial [Myxococcaceae bacterium]|nr:AMP-binding protein [Myxococcaceae bacterium]
GKEVTYQELDRRSDALAAAMQDAGVRRGDRVVVWGAKSADTIAAWFGALKAGAAYVPLDRTTPAPRAGAIVDATRARVVVLDAPLAGEPPWSARDVTVLTSGVEGSARPRPVEATDLDLAYLYFTSGSTGRPKGVAISHRASISYLDIGDGILRGGPDDVVAQHAPLGFDLASFDVHLAVRWAARLVFIPAATALTPDSMLEFLESEQPTVMYAVPTALHRLAALESIEERRVPSLRALLFAGEPPVVPALRRLRRTFANATFHHWYGSTEAALVTAAAFPPGAELPDPMPIGPAVPNVELGLLVEGREGVSEVAPGTSGELVVSATLLLDGYWGEEQGASAFVTGPKGGAELPRRWFKTRDLVRCEADGSLFYVIRTDRMLKVRGMRVDPAEVEAALLGFDGVRECSVVARPDPEAGARLFVFFVGSAGSETALGAYARERLPAYMLPERFFRLDGLPTTETGKVDRRALAERLGGLLAAG